MKTYITLIKDAKAKIEYTQKVIENAYRDQNNLENQIEHLMETLQHEQIESSLHKAFFNPTYFDRLTNKIKAYRHLLKSKQDEIEILKDEMFSLFSMRKKYEILLESLKIKRMAEHRKRETEQLEELFRPKVL